MKKIVFILLIITTMFFAGCDIIITTANITDGTMASGMEEGKPLDSIEVYSQDATALYAFGVLNNAPDETKVTFVWNYVTEPQEIYRLDYTAEEVSGMYVYTELTNNGLWPLGDYYVEIYIDDRTDPDVTIEFSVEE